MNSISRVAPLLLLATVAAAGACRKTPEPAPVPAVNQDSIDAAARERARQDSLAAIERTRQDSLAAIERARQDSIAGMNSRMGAMRSALTAAVMFEYDQSELTDDGRAVLDAKLPIMNANPSLRVRIAGHTDSRGSDEYNLALGQRRAASVKRYLVQRGIDGARLEVTSFGEERAVASGEDESAYAQNRRAEFEVTAGGDDLMMPAGQ